MYIGKLFSQEKDIVNHYCLLLIIIYLIIQNLPKNFHSDLVKNILCNLHLV